MGLGNIFNGKRESKPVELPALLQPENPVNYDSVLDYLVGLGQKDFDKLIKVTGIYREANKSAAKVLGVKDQPTTALVEEKQSDDAIDTALDGLLETNPADLKAAIEAEAKPAEPKKAQAPSNDKKITVNEA